MKAEYIWFHVVVLIVSVLIIGLAAVNIYYFNKLRGNPTTDVTKNIAITMIVLNAVAIALCIIVFIWAVSRLVVETVTTEARVGSVTDTLARRRGWAPDPEMRYSGYWP
jgi:hypothetical protein